MSDARVQSVQYVRQALCLTLGFSPVRMSDRRALSSLPTSPYTFEPPCQQRALARSQRGGSSTSYARDDRQTALSPEPDSAAKQAAQTDSSYCGRLLKVHALS